MTSATVNMFLYVCMFLCMHGACVDACMSMYVCMHACMHACMLVNIAQMYWHRGLLDGSLGVLFVLPLLLLLVL